ncbi:CHAP domain-containing protein [Nocardioides sp. SOB77]|uniref:CHAP domain-containing protein n=1 Tax=Nocardioides oceani TaxID=3058369 RepID=A0ABT8FMD0_9ACTN|nr:CHAP domain-containing protein [Nocardioides oceani]MDN4175822.1 CHAP domain-containing protein [Nocardioides oceani]
MYAGHNCTNYVAYRLIESGMPNARPWEGSGNANNWGAEMASITDQVPRVGAVAWWKANVPPAGSAGHVAYVEKVISSTEIVVSEDYWGGDFHWRRITKTGTGWPSGFIHFNDVELEPTAPPAVTDAPTVGRPLEVQPGTWTPTATSFSYRWLAGGKPISGVTTAAYTPSPEHRGKALTIEVTATRNGFESGTATLTTRAVAPGTLVPTEPPTIEGTVEVDRSLSLRPATWSPAPASTTVQWYADGVAVPGATGSTFQLGQEQIDQRITARVTATAPGYRKAAAASEATTPVLAGAISVRSPFAIAGRPRIGKTLTVESGAVEPADAAVAYTWLRDGEPVPGANSQAYILGPGDVGRSIAVRLDVSRPSYRSAVHILRAVGPITTVPALRVRPRGESGRAAISVRVTAPGASAPSGNLTVRVGRRTVNATLTNGRGLILVPELRAGVKRVVVRYSGTNVVSPAVARSSVEVLPTRG